MSYLKGDYYVWRDDNALHIEGPDIRGQLPLYVFDALVAMRYAQLNLSQLTSAIEYALDLGEGNLGAEALNVACGGKTFSDFVKLFQQKYQNATLLVRDERPAGSLGGPDPDPDPDPDKEPA